MKSSQGSIASMSSVNQSSVTGQMLGSQPFQHQQQQLNASQMTAYGVNLSGSNGRGNGSAPSQFQSYAQQQASQIQLQPVGQLPQPLTQQQQQYCSSQVPQQQLQEQFQLQQQNIQARLAGSLSLGAAGATGAVGRSSQVLGWHVGGTGSVGGSAAGGIGAPGNQQSRQQKVATPVPESRQQSSIKGFGTDSFCCSALFQEKFECHHALLMSHAGDFSDCDAYMELLGIDTFSDSKFDYVKIFENFNSVKLCSFYCIIK